MTRFDMLAATSALAIGLGAAGPALAQGAAPMPPRQDVEHAIAAIAAHHDMAARTWMQRAGTQIRSHDATSPVLQDLGFARRELMNSRSHVAMQDLYGALPLIHAPA